MMKHYNPEKKIYCVRVTVRIFAARNSETKHDRRKATSPKFFASARILQEQ
jgi:hypothetical protein